MIRFEPSPNCELQVLVLPAIDGGAAEPLGNRMVGLTGHLLGFAFQVAVLVTAPLSAFRTRARLRAGDCVHLVGSAEMLDASAIGLGLIVVVVARDIRLVHERQSH